MSATRATLTCLLNFESHDYVSAMYFTKLAKSMSIIRQQVFFPMFNLCYDNIDVILLAKTLVAVSSMH